MHGVICKLIIMVQLKLVTYLIAVKDQISIVPIYFSNIFKINYASYHFNFQPYAKYIVKYILGHIFPNSRALPNYILTTDTLFK